MSSLRALPYKEGGSAARSLSAPGGPITREVHMLDSQGLMSESCTKARLVGCPFSFCVSEWACSHFPSWIIIVTNIAEKGTLLWQLPG